MICYLLYNRQTSAERVVAELSDRLEHEGVAYELVDADSPRGIQLAENYDIMARPAVLVVKDDGAPVQVWQGDELPPLADITYLARQ